MLQYVVIQFPLCYLSSGRIREVHTLSFKSGRSVLAVFLFFFLVNSAALVRSSERRHPSVRACSIPPVSILCVKKIGTISRKNPACTLAPSPEKKVAKREESGCTQPRKNLAIGGLRCLWLLLSFYPPRLGTCFYFFIKTFYMAVFRSFLSSWKKRFVKHTMNCEHYTWSSEVLTRARTQWR